MSKTEYAKLRCPVSACKTFASAATSSTAGTPYRIYDTGGVTQTMVYPLESATAAGGIVAYDIPGVKVTKKTSTEIWVAGEYIYNYDLDGWSNVRTYGTDPCGIILEASASGTTTGVIHFKGMGIMIYA
jgi:hypothetical protein